MDPRLQTTYSTLDTLLPYYTLKDPTLLEAIFSEGSRILTEVITSMGYANKCDKIAKNLYLGMLPGFGNYKQIIATAEKDGAPLGMVLSVVPIWQLSGIKVDPPKVWKDENVKQVVLPIPDFTAEASSDDIMTAVLMMRDCVQANKSVLVHCKAGKSRSAMVCLIYLYFFGRDENLGLSGRIQDIKQDIQKIAVYLKQKRLQVDILNPQLEKAEEVISYMKQKQLENKLNYNQPEIATQENDKIDLSNIKEELKKLIWSPQTKKEIVHLHSFIKLGHYALCNQNSSLKKAVNQLAYYLNIQDEQKDSLQTKCVKDAFMTIYNASDESWYLDLVGGKGPLKKLVEINDSYSFSLWSNLEDKKERESLRAEFVEELTAYFAEQLNCPVSAIKEAAELLAKERNQLQYEHK
ncbi:dual specificity protein phosphatase family protein [Aquicella lusitana]|uniref:Dual specificity protein phosphatase-like protein n=1 Tax=Aquicella lusitana TaxID=254246 RepID=A0A370GLK9_9COXI|nr:dual specificity protein phosphatase family protein [Aquicella lusitana]RDI44605.1 dual specificity protein phosphatase-like protein [Aquicella lusitana]VVC72453.1 hypothetical protein AQULUS_01650 [Aquicella lusitana]